jgi:hypothetical protein
MRYLRVASKSGSTQAAGESALAALSPRLPRALTPTSHPRFGLDTGLSQFANFSPGHAARPGGLDQPVRQGLAGGHR